MSASLKKSDSTALTKREYHIIHLIAEGRSSKEIGNALNTTEMTIRNYVGIIYDKLGLSCRLELGLWYIKNVVVEKEQNNDAMSIMQTRNNYTAA